MLFEYNAFVIAVVLIFVSIRVCSLKISNPYYKLMGSILD